MGGVRDLGDEELASDNRAAWARHGVPGDRDPVEIRAALGSVPLGEAFAETARLRVDDPAIALGGRVVTHGDLDEMAGRVASILGRLGVGPGSRVLLIADVGIEEMAAYLGVLRVGAVVVLANPGLTGPEFASLREKSGAEWLVGSGPALSVASRSIGGRLREVAGLRPEDETAASLLVDETEGVVIPPIPVDPRSTAILAFTSGTTGPAKPAPLSHINLLSSIRSAMLAWRWSHRDHLAHSLPVSHQHGLSGIHATLLAGSRITLLGAFDPRRTLRAVADEAVSVHFGVPTIYSRLLETSGDDVTALGGLRLATSGSGPLPVDLANHYRARVGVGLLERYGTTESGLNLSNPYEGERRAGWVGLPLPGVEVAIAKPDGAICEPEEIGEVMIRGPQVFAGYEGVPESGQPFVSGWFRTGDLGTRDPSNGFFRIVGRTKEVIITGGMNVYPREVEEVLRAHPDVTDAVVFGVESAEWGEEVVAVVTPASVSRGEVANYLVGRLAGFKRPKRLFALDQVPRNAVGKIEPEAVRELVTRIGSDTRHAE